MFCSLKNGLWIDIAAVATQVPTSKYQDRFMKGVFFMLDALGPLFRIRKVKEYYLVSAKQTIF